MTLSRLLAQTITITHVSVGPADEYGDATITTSSTTTTGRIYQASTEEQVAAGDITTSLHRLFLPAGTMISSADHVTAAGDPTVYQVTGAPDVVLGARAAHHIEAQLKVIEG